MGWDIKGIRTNPVGVDICFLATRNAHIGMEERKEGKIFFFSYDSKVIKRVVIMAWVVVVLDWVVHHTRVLVHLQLRDGYKKCFVG